MEAHPAGDASPSPIHTVKFTLPGKSSMVRIGGIEINRF